jgi:hypothetical protein
VATRRQQELKASPLKLKHVSEDETKRRKVQLLIQQSAARRRGASGYEAKCRPAAPHLSFPAMVGRPAAAGYVDLGQGYEGVMQQIMWQGFRGLI